MHIPNQYQCRGPRDLGCRGMRLQATSCSQAFPHAAQPQAPGWSRVDTAARSLAKDSWGQESRGVPSPTAASFLRASGHPVPLWAAVSPAAQPGEESGTGPRLWARSGWAGQRLSPQHQGPGVPVPARPPLRPQPAGALRPLGCAALLSELEAQPWARQNRFLPLVGAVPVWWLLEAVRRGCVFGVTQRGVPAAPAVGETCPQRNIESEVTRRRYLRALRGSVPPRGSVQRPWGGTLRGRPGRGKQRGQGGSSLGSECLSLGV